MKLIFNYSIILVFPLIFLWSGSNFHRAKFINDPNYIYLMNAVVICNGKAVGHIDNPGTTVMQIGAATIGLKHLLSGADQPSLNENVLKNPEEFLEAMQNVLLFLNALVLFLLGIVTFKKTGSIWVALFLQVTVFLSANTLDHVWTKISPEPFLFFISCSFVAAILYSQYSNVKSYKRDIIVFALLTGAGMATKATFLPLAIFPLFIFQGVKHKIYYITASIACFVLFTIPAIPEYESMYWWFRNLISHSGVYGQGAKTIINTDTYFQNIKGILSHNILLGIVIGLSVVVLTIASVKEFVKYQRIRFSTEGRTLAGLIASTFFGVLLVAKHYFANHYLIPVLLLTGITFYFSIIVLFKLIQTGHLKNLFFGIVTLVLVAFLYWKQLPVMQKINYYYKISNEENDLTYNLIKQEYSDYTVINYYTFSLNKFNALKFGDICSKNKMLPNLKQTYPDTYFFDPAINEFVHWDEIVPLDQITSKKGNKLLLVSGPKEQQQIEALKSRGIFLETVCTGRVQVLHKINLQENTEE